MRIIYLKLKNFIGIFNGAGKYEIELDFKENKNKIILLLGENGSGKTTILSALHPFATTMDERHNFILADKDGYKEIHIRDGKKLYKIEHHYLTRGSKKMTKSFIAIKENKKWKELNENGTVNSFLDIVKNELDIDEGFLRLTRIGSNVTNFIDLKTAERKKLPFLFLPDVGEYLHYYKIVNEKWLDSKKRITSIVNDINKLDTAEHLESLKQTLTSQIKAKEEILDGKKEKFNQNLGAIEALDPDHSIWGSYLEGMDTRKELREELGLLEGESDELIEKYPSFAEFKTHREVERKLASLEKREDGFKNRLENLAEEKKRVMTEIIGLKNDLAEKGVELERYKTGNDLDEYEELLISYKEKVRELNQDIEKFADTYLSDWDFSNVDTEDVDTYERFITRLNERIEILKTKYDSCIIEGVLRGSNPEGQKFLKTLKSHRTSLKEYEVKIEEKKKECWKLQEKIGLKDILAQRPAKCKIDDCVFIAESLKYKDVDNMIQDLETEIEGLEEKYTTISETYAVLDGKYNFFNELTTLFQSAEDNRVLVAKFPDGKFFSTMEDFKGYFEMDKNDLNDITDLREYVELKAQLVELEETEIPRIETNIKFLKTSSKLIKNLEKDIELLKASIEKKDADLLEIDEKIGEAERKSKGVKKLIEKMGEYNELVEKIESINNTIDGITTSIRANKSLLKTIGIHHSNNEELGKDITELENTIEPLVVDLDKVKFNIEKLNDYNQKKKELEDNFADYEIVRKALSPTKGIPLLFIDVYLKKTKRIANELLDIAFGGKFYLDDFELTENDFFIRAVKEDGEMVSDIKICSQGEVSLGSIAISLALIQQSMYRYNILLLDEIDSMLDDDNRRSFIDILEKQLEVLGVEQTFIISHNQAFDTYNVDLILMKNSNVDIEDEGYMTGKNIIFKI